MVAGFSVVLEGRLLANGRTLLFDTESPGEAYALPYVAGG
jgi:hypothetical protein